MEAAPIVTAVPLHTVLALPGAGVGNALTVTVTLFDLVQVNPVLDSVRVYVVVVVGDTDGFDDVEEIPDGLDDQLYVLLVTEGAPIFTEVPLHIVWLLATAPAGLALNAITFVAAALEQ